MGLFDSIRRVVGGGESTDAEDAATDEQDADLIDTRELDVTALRQQAEGVAAEVEQLDFSLASLEQFDAAIEAGYDEALPTTDDPETYPRDVVRFGCYLGEVLVRVYGGRWEQNPEWGVTVSGSEDDATVAVFRVATRSITDEAVFAAVAERVAQEVGIEVDDGTPEPADDGAGETEGSPDDGASQTEDEADAVGTATPAGEPDPDGETVPDESGDADDAGESGDGDEPPTEAVEPAGVDTGSEDDIEVDGDDAASETAGLSERRPREPDALKSGFGPVDEPAADEADAPDAGAADGTATDGAEAEPADETAADEPEGEPADESELGEPTEEPEAPGGPEPDAADEPAADETESVADKWSDDGDGPGAAESADEATSPAEGAGSDVDADDTDGDDGSEAAAGDAGDHGAVPDSDDGDESPAPAPDAAGEAGASGDDADDVASLVEEAEPDADDEPWFEEAEPEPPASEEPPEATDTSDEPATDETASLFGGDEPDADAMPPAEESVDSEGGADETADEGPMPPADDTAGESVSPADDTAGGSVSPADDTAGGSVSPTDESTGEPDPTDGDGLRAEYAEEAEAFVSFWSEHDLDYSPESLARLDELVAAEWDDDRFETATFQSDETFDDRAFTSVVTELGSYFGEVLVRALDAEWSDQTATDSVIVDGVDGQLAIPVFRVAETSLRKSPVFARSYDSLLEDLGRGD